MSQTKKQFDNIKDRYLKAYKINNGKDIFRIWYSSGWVYLRSSEDSIASRYRVQDLEKMTLNLESR